MNVVARLTTDYHFDWHYAFGGPLGHCHLKSHDEDFVVDESLSFEPTGHGEHLFLLIEKKGENTDQVANLLARQAKVRRNAVSYAGRKDYHAITRQWFCISLPGVDDPDFSPIESDSMRLIQQVRHSKKLKIGSLKSNTFCITLRNIDANTQAVDTRINRIVNEGVPNYYGPQRFGHHGRNVYRAIHMMMGKTRLNRNKRSIHLSAARSWLFNWVLSEKVRTGIWNQYLPGDVLGFPDNNSLILDEPDETTIKRLNSGELSPTSPLWGSGVPKVTNQAMTFEQSTVASYPQLCHGLEKTGLRQERRVNRLIPQNMTWRWQNHPGQNTMILKFSLPRGCFATSVIRELFHAHDTQTVHRDHPVSFEQNRSGTLETI